jgi:hypothetical protein
MMPLLVKRLVKEHLHSGFTKEDIQRLAQIQASYSPKTDDPTRINNKLLKMTKSSAEIPPATMGKICADVVCILKEAAAATKFQSVGRAAVKANRSWETAKQILQTGAIVSGLGAITGVGAGAINVLVKSQDKKKLEKKLSDSFEEAMKRSDPSTEPLHANKEKARMAFNTLTHFAPHVAVEPEAARAFMLNMVGMDHGVQVGTVKDLAEIEKNLRSSKGSNPFFEGLAAGSSAMGMQGALSRSTGQLLDPFVQQGQEEIGAQIGWERPTRN